MNSDQQSLSDDAELKRLQRELVSIYTVERLLLRRGTAVVYQAAEIKPARPVALRIFPPELGLGAVAERFRELARVLVALNHPAILPVYRVGFKAGVPYFVAMKFVEGRRLDEIIESQGALSVPAVMAVVRAIAAALGYVHAKGTVHGALTPACILVDRDGQVMVSEFGIARGIEDAAVAAGGRARIGSPEEAGGGSPSPLADQYALGMVALETLSGSDLVPDPMASLREVRSARVAVPDALVRALQTALAQDPAQRFASTADLVAQIEAIPFSDADGREAAVVLGRLARGEPVPKVRALAPPRAATQAVSAIAPERPAPAAPAVAPSAPTPEAAPTQRPTPAPRPAPAAPVASITPLMRPPPPAARPQPPAPPVVEAPARPEPPAPRAVETPVGPEPPAPLAVEAQTRPEPAAPSAEEVPAGTAVEPQAVAPPAPEPPAPEPTPAAQPERPRRSAPPRVVTAPEPAAKAGSRLVWVLAALLVVAVLGGGAYWLLLRPRAAQPVVQAPVAPAPSAPTTSVPPAPVAAVAESVRSDTAKARPTTGFLSVGVEPGTADIFVDGRRVGSGGALDSVVTAGRRRVRIVAPGFATLDTAVTLRGGDSLALDITMVPSSAPQAAPAPATTGRLELSVDPPTAEIFLDGQRIGVGAVAGFEVDAGQRQLVITAAGYLPLDTLITVDVGTTVRLGRVSLKTSP